MKDDSTHEEETERTAPFTLEGITMTYSQEPDSNAPTEVMLNQLEIEVTDAGGGHYLVLRTERWAIDPDQINDLAAMLRRALRIVEKQR